MNLFTTNNHDLNMTAQLHPVSVGYHVGRVTDVVELPCVCNDSHCRVHYALQPTSTSVTPLSVC